MRHRTWIILGIACMLLLAAVQLLLLSASRSEALAPLLQVTENIRPLRAIGAACLAGVIGASIVVWRHTAEH